MRSQGTIVEEALRRLGGTGRVSEIARTAGRDMAAVGADLRRLRLLGRVEKIDYGLYRLTPTSPMAPDDDKPGRGAGDHSSAVPPTRTPQPRARTRITQSIPLEGLTAGVLIAHLAQARQAVASDAFVFLGADGGMLTITFEDPD